MIAQPYPEKRIQLAATDWLTANWGYREIYNDVEGRGVRVDTIGFIDGRLHLIEVKVTVGSGIVDHALDRSMSLESKFASALGSLYARESHPVWDLVNRHWDRRSRPVITTIAERYSTPGLMAVKAMIGRCAPTWEADYRAWQWTGSEVVECLKETLPGDPVSFDNIVVPRLVGRTPRAKALSRDELLNLAAQHGTRALFEALWAIAVDRGFKIVRRRDGIGLMALVAGFNVPQTVISVFLSASSAENGLNVGCWREAAGVSEADLPGRPAPRAGFMNTNRFVGDRDQVDQLLRIFAPAIPASHAKSVM